VDLGKCQASRGDYILGSFEKEGNMGRGCVCVLAPSYHVFHFAINTSHLLLLYQYIWQTKFTLFQKWCLPLSPVMVAVKADCGRSFRKAHDSLG
jgi:hypothetical protein